MGASVKLRGLRLDDVEPLVALVERTAVFRPHEVAVARELLEAGAARDEASGYLFQVFEDGEEAAGYACYGETPCTEGTFDLYWIAAAPRLQGRGVASRLLEAVAGDVVRRGGRLLVAETEDSPPYEAARAFYEARGFKRAACIADFYRPGAAKVVYTRALDAKGGK